MGRYSPTKSQKDRTKAYLWQGSESDYLCFVITQLGGDIHPELCQMREQVDRLCLASHITPIDATHKVTGKDILIKIWRLIAATPI